MPVKGIGTYSLLSNTFTILCLLVSVRHSLGGTNLQMEHLNGTWNVFYNKKYKVPFKQL